MYSYFSDLHVTLLSQGLLEAGEQLVSRTVTEHNPWWAFGLFRKTYLILATNQRLILVEHRMAWLHASLKLHGVESMPWSQVEEARITGLFNKKVRLRGHTQSGPKRLVMKVPNALFGLLAPMRNNMQGARAVVGTFQGARQLSSSLPPASLPYAAYGAPQLAAPPSFTPGFAQPAINSQGYASVPPPQSEHAPTQASHQHPLNPPRPGIPPRPYSQS